MMHCHLSFQTTVILEKTWKKNPTKASATYEITVVPRRTLTHNNGGNIFIEYEPFPWMRGGGVVIALDFRSQGL